MKDRYLAAHPGAFFLDADDLPALTRYLRAQGWIGPDGSVAAAARAGEGNMNCTLRAILASGETLIVKQSRPWVEKYPQIPAPRDRALVEARFYQVTADALEGRQPRLAGADPAARVLAMEDLGAAQDFMDLYASAPLGDEALSALLAYLGALHTIPAPCDAVLQNRAMRALNHEHIFDLPLRGVLDLDGYTPGLTEAAAPLLADADYCAQVRSLGERYLADGPALLHGDFYPGSWVRTAGGLRVLDPEFCFPGPPAFDVGVMVAHLQLAGQDPARSSAALDGYPGALDEALALRFAGVEIMRRLIGVAQLPLSAGLERKRALLRLSRALVVAPSRGVLRG